MLSLKTILCPVDFSEPSLAALDVAVQWAQHFVAELHVLHVMPLQIADLVIGIPGTLPSDAERHDDAMRALNVVVGNHVPTDIPCQIDVRTGNADEEIIYKSQDKPVDLIILATHGRTGWRHLLLGSVAEQIVRQAKCPVLTVQQTKPKVSLQEQETAVSVGGGAR
jgi:universal stress protein A